MSEQTNNFLNIDIKENYIQEQNIKFNNAVFYINKNESKLIDLENIFKNLNLDDTIIFLKYNDIIKNEFIRLNNTSIFPGKVSLDLDINELKNKKTQLSKVKKQINNLSKSAELDDNISHILNTLNLEKDQF